MQPWTTPIAAFLIGLCLAHPAKTEVAGSPDVLVLGDSQLSFGAGKAFIALFQTLKGQCGLATDTTVGVIGVRSSTLQSWTSQGKAAKGAICNIDQKWKVNAGVYGSLAQARSPFVQIGQGEQFQFCSPDRSPLQAVFHNGYYRPKLLVMFLMGNATERWAGNADAALQDVRSFVADLPKGQPCIFMTSAPPYREGLVRLRQKAQANVAAAFAKAGGSCHFVAGFTPETVQANLGNAAHFRRKGAGKVNDPFHPNETAQRQFMALRRDALCMAVAAALAPQYAPITTARPG